MTQIPFLNVIGKSKVGKNMSHLFKLGARFTGLSGQLYVNI